MSTIEQRIERLTKAIEDLTAATLAATKAPATTTTTTKAESAPADKPAAKTTPARTTKAEPKKEPETKTEAPAEDKSAEKELTEADLIAAFTAYLPRDLTKEERAKRAPKIKAFLTEKGVAKATELKADDYAEAIAFVNDLVAALGTDESSDEDDSLL